MDSDVNDPDSDIEFYLYYITKKDSKGEYSYKLPENVVGIHEVFLDELSNVDGKWGKTYNFSKVEKRNMSIY